jgi:hypothetical protein
MTKIGIYLQILVTLPKMKFYENPFWTLIELCADRKQIMHIFFF